VATIITHAAAGAALVQFIPDRIRTVRVMICLAFAGLLPDLDVIMFALDIPYSHVLGHRGFSHSILFAGLIAFPITFIAVSGKTKDKKSVIMTAVIFFMAVMSHGILDAFTDAGLGVGFFIPFNDERYFFSWRPVMTSSLNPSSFLTEKTLLILKNEFLHIWLPIATVSVLHFRIKHLHLMFLLLF
jgi:inner membrane protein